MSARRKSKRAARSSGDQAEPGPSTPTRGRRWETPPDTDATYTHGSPVRPSTANAKAAQKAGHEPPSKGAEAREASSRPRSTKKLEMGSVQVPSADEVLRQVPKLAADSSGLTRPLPASELLLGAGRSPGRKQKVSRKEALSTATGLRQGKGGTLIAVRSTPSDVAQRSGRKRPAAALSPPHPKRKQIVQLSTRETVQLPPLYATLLEAFKVVDKALSVAHNLQQRSVPTLTKQVQKTTGHDFTQAHLQMMLTVAQPMITVNMIGRGENGVLVLKSVDANSGIVPHRSKRSQQLAPRAKTFRDNLVKRLTDCASQTFCAQLCSTEDVEVAPKQLKGFPELTSNPPPIELAVLPSRATPTCAGGVRALDEMLSIGPTDVQSSEAGPAVATANEGAAIPRALDAMRARIRNKQHRKQKEAGSGMSAKDRALYSNLEHLDDVARRIEALKDQGRVRTAKKVSHVVETLRHNNREFTRTLATELLTLLCSEVATLCAGKKPWCSIITVPEGEECCDYLQVLREFEWLPVKLHVTRRLEALKTSTHT